MYPFLQGTPLPEPPGSSGELPPPPTPQKNQEMVLVGRSRKTYMCSCLAAAPLPTGAPRQRSAKCLWELKKGVVNSVVKSVVKSLVRSVVKML